MEEGVGEFEGVCLFCGWTLWGVGCLFCTWNVRGRQSIVYSKFYPNYVIYKKRGESRILHAKSKGGHEFYAQNLKGWSQILYSSFNAKFSTPPSLNDECLLTIFDYTTNKNICIHMVNISFFCHQYIYFSIYMTWTNKELCTLH